MFVTDKQIKKLVPDYRQRRKFVLLFPQGVELTRELIIKHAEKFDWHWCIGNLNSEEVWPLWRQAEEQAHDSWRQAAGAAGVTLNQSLAKGKDLVHPVSMPAQLAYNRAIKQAETAYNLACAQAFADVAGL